MKNEAAVKKAIVKALRKAGAWYTMPHQRGYSQAGVPDILALHNGRFIGIEVKFNGNKPTINQEIQMALIEDAGGDSMVLDETNWTLIHGWLNVAD